MQPRKKTGASDKVEQQMTPMIDIVFQLLAFFVMTFQIVSPEGDFNVKMPLTSAGKTTTDQLPLRVRLTAKNDGHVDGLYLGDKSLGAGSIAFDRLHDEIVALVGTDRGPGSIADTAEVQLDCDYGLHYDHAVRAITAISGTVDSAGHFVKLIEKIKFAPPRVQ